MTQRRTKIAVAAAFVALCLIWSSTWLAIKFGLRDLPPISFVAIRFLIAVAVLLAISIGRVPLIPRGRGDFKLLAWTGVLMFCVNYALLFWAELYVSSGLSAVLQATIPIFGMVFAHYIIPNEPLRGARIAGARRMARAFSKTFENAAPAAPNTIPTPPQKASSPPKSRRREQMTATPPIASTAPAMRAPRSGSLGMM